MMLKELYIENLAVIEKISINFDIGLTALTGETGAGKSILIDAINLVLGQRSSKEIVRTGAKKAFVSGVFSDVSAQVKALLNESGFDIGEEDLIISREITADAKSSAKIMNRPVTVALLKEIGTMLINIHGQHDSQMLLNSDNHINILDAFSANESELSLYKSEYDEYNRLKNEYKKLASDEGKKQSETEYLNFVIEELEKANIKVGEDEEIEKNITAMRNHVRISKSLTQTYFMLNSDGSDGEFAVTDMIASAISKLEAVEECDEKIKGFSQKLSSIKYELDEVVLDIGGMLDNLDFDQSEYDNLEYRFDLINKLKRKYNLDLNGIIKLYDESKEKLDKIKFADEEKLILIEKINKQKKIVMDKAHMISQKRNVSAQKFGEKVERELIFLDMPNVKLKVNVQKGKYGAKGCDIVEFLFSTNKGEELKSISKIASGGELSRIMLAIKSTMAQKDNINSLIFDEIDTGVSGKSAQKIGMKLREVSKNRQVMCVTHSAQIAALADNNLFISKRTKDERTFTEIKLLSYDEKIEEVARIMGTDVITKLTLQNAKEMVETSKNS